jgi:hypothetical protein
VALYEGQWDARTLVGLEFYAADDTTKIGERKLELIESNGTGYDAAAVSAVAPAGTVFVRPVVEFDSVGSAGPQRGAAFDNAELREISVGDNRTANPGFLDLDADGTFGDGWFSFGAAGFLDFFGSGNPGHGILFGDNIFNVGSVFQLRIPAIEGLEYEVSADVQFEVNWDAEARLAVEFYASDDATKLGETVLMLPALETRGEGYKRYRVSGVAPAGTAYVRPIVDYDFVLTGGVSRAATIDNVIVRETTSERSLNPSFEDVVGDGAFRRLLGHVRRGGFRRLLCRNRHRPRRPVRRYRGQRGRPVSGRHPGVGRRDLRAEPQRGVRSRVGCRYAVRAGVLRG